MPNLITHNTPQVNDTVDTVAVDSNAVLLEPHYVAAFDSATVTVTDSTLKSVTTLPTMQQPPTDHAVPVAPTLLHDTSAMSLLMTGLLLILVSYHTGYKYLEDIFHNMFSTRKRENLFEDHTMNETRILTALTINTCIMEALLTYMAVIQWMPWFKPSLQSNILLHVGAFAILALLFYLAQLVVYNIIGIVFSDRANTKLWTDGFKATHSLLGLLLFPVLALLFVMPSLAKVTLICAISMYFCARIVFICKGFRIFYSNLPSCVYFILYLCAVEIVPIAILIAGIIFLCNLLQ